MPDKIAFICPTGGAISGQDLWDIEEELISQGYTSIKCVDPWPYLVGSQITGTCMYNSMGDMSPVPSWRTLARNNRKLSGEIFEKYGKDDDVTLVLMPNWEKDDTCVQNRENALNLGWKVVHATELLREQIEEEQRLCQ